MKDGARLVDCVWNMMAHVQKPDFIFRRNGLVHLNRSGYQFSRLLAAEACASALVMQDTPRSEIMWEYWLPTSFASSPFTSPPVRHRVPSGFKCTLLDFLHQGFGSHVISYCFWGHHYWRQVQVLILWCMYVCVWSFTKDRLYINKLHSFKECKQHVDAAMPLNHTHIQHLPHGGYKGQLEITSHINCL